MTNSEKRHRSETDIDRASTNKTKSEGAKPKMPEFSPTRGGFEIGPDEPTPKAKGEQG